MILDLVLSGRAVLVCPEEEGGLGTPRPAAEITGGRVFTDEGRDVTAEYLQGSRIAVERASEYDCRVAILKARSPACGCGTVYDGTFTGRIVEGDGVAAAALREAGLDLWTEEDVSA